MTTIVDTTRNTGRFKYLGYVWAVWLSNWRFWALLPVLLLGGLWVLATIPASPGNWIDRVCGATGQDQRAARWCARNGFEVPMPAIYGGIGAWPAIVVAGLAMLGAAIALVAKLVSG